MVIKVDEIDVDAVFKGKTVALFLQMIARELKQDGTSYIFINFTICKIIQKL